MSRVVGIGELSSAVNELLEEYGDKAREAIMKAAPRAARQARNTLKETSPVGSHDRHYNAGWATQTQGVRSGIGIRVVVHNKTKPGLTHLLEHGHALRGGGRAGARPHIAAANNAARKQFIEDVEKALRKG